MFLDKNEIFKDIVILPDKAALWYINLDLVAHYGTGWSKNYEYGGYLYLHLFTVLEFGVVCVGEWENDPENDNTLRETDGFF